MKHAFSQGEGNGVKIFQLLPHI